MGYPPPSDSSDALRQANQLAGVQWQCWAYDAAERTLVLCAYPDRYLIFRLVTAVCLPFYFQGATFRARPHHQDQRQVVIEAQGKEFWIDCREVLYLETEPHTRVEALWDQMRKPPP